MKYTILKYTSFLFAILLIFGCTTDDIYTKADKPSFGNNYRFLIQVPASEKVTNTRAVSNSDIDLSMLQILVYDEKDLYVTTGDIDFTNNPPKWNETLGVFDVTVALPVIEDPSTIVFIANIAELSDIDFDAPLTNLYENLRLSYSGKWGNGSSSLVPMSGEIKGLVLNDEYDGKPLGVDLLRSMAKLEVQTELSEAAFKINSAYVYLSLADGLIIPQADKLSTSDDGNIVTAPSLIPNTPFNLGEGTPTTNIEEAKQSPLVYSLNANDAPELIYIPEQGMNSDNSQDVFLVIGGYFMGSTKESFYKVSFGADLLNKGFDVLRNHRYILNIKKVNGLGFPTYEDAMKAPSTNIVVDIVIWDENINDGYVFGDKYFGIEQKSIYFDKPDAGQTQVVSFQTNMSDDVLNNGLNYELLGGNNTKFELTLNTEKRQFEITTFKNESRELNSDHLVINIYGQIFDISIGQSPGNFDYYIDCDSVKVYGVYIPSQPLDEKNFIEVSVNSDEDMTGAYYRIFSNEIDGISFMGDGLFEMVENSGGYFSQTVKLDGTGIPKTSFTKYLNLYMNTTEVQNCGFSVQMIYSKKNIVAQSLNISATGFVMNNSYSELFRESPFNFGPHSYSSVKIEDFDYNYLPVKVNNYLESDNEALQTALNNADILITGKSFGDRSYTPREYTPALKKIIEDRAAIVVNFLKEKGVVVMVEHDFVYLEAFFNALYNNNIELEFYNTGGSLSTSYLLGDIPNDPVLNGPFGDLVGKSWGAEGLTYYTPTRPSRGAQLHSIVGIPESDILIYNNGLSADDGSYSGSAGSYKPLKGAVIFKHLKYNLFVIAFDGFNLGVDDASSSNYYIFDAFNIDIKDGTYRPIPKLKFGNSTNNQSVYNSAFWGNVMNWAFYSAEFHGRYSDPY